MRPQWQISPREEWSDSLEIYLERFESRLPTTEDRRNRFDWTPVLGQHDLSSCANRESLLLQREPFASRHERLPHGPGDKRWLPTASTQLFCSPRRIGPKVLLARQMAPGEAVHPEPQSIRGFGSLRGPGAGSRHRARGLQPLRDASLSRPSDKRLRAPLSA